MGKRSLVFFVLTFGFILTACMGKPSTLTPVEINPEQMPHPVATQPPESYPTALEDAIPIATELPESHPTALEEAIPAAPEIDQIPAAIEVLPSLFTSNCGPEGGIINHLVIDQQNPAILYALPNAPGIYKSVDGGENWLRLPISDETSSN